MSDLEKRAANLPALPQSYGMVRKARALVEQTKLAEFQLQAQGHLARKALDEETETVIQGMQDDQLEVSAAITLYNETERRALDSAKTQRGLSRAIRHLEEMDERNAARLNRRRP